LVLVLALALIPALAAAPPATATNPPVPLVVPQSTGFAVLGHNCGGIRQDDFVTGFDTATGYTHGYPDGVVYLWTTCSCGKVCSTTFKAWVSVVWDFTATLVSDTVLAAAPTVNPTLSLSDGHGNQIYNQTNAAYLVLAPGFVPAPRVAAVSPASAPQGTTVAISGTGFTGATAVSFGNHPAAFTVTSDTTITAIAPAVRTASVYVRVTGPGGASVRNPAAQFTFTLTPRIAALSPASGTADGGTKVTITGDNFTGVTAVYIGNSAAFKIVNAHTITATTPPGSDVGVSVPVTVTSGYGTSNAATFLYTN
jgi:hypothetical protein